MQRNAEFSPIDYSKQKILPVALEDFQRALIEHISSDTMHYFNYCTVEEGRLILQYINCDYSKRVYYCHIGNKRIDIDINSIEEVYKGLKPMYGEQYLENGKLHSRRGYYGTEK